MMPRTSNLGLKHRLDGILAQHNLDLHNPGDRREAADALNEALRRSCPPRVIYGAAGVSRRTPQREAARLLAERFVLRCLGAAAPAKGRP